MIGCWLARGLDSLVSPSLIGARFATVRCSEWFRWFAWMEAGRESLTDGGMAVGFRPECGAPVDLTLQQDVRQRVMGIKLAVAATFLANKSRPFALDMLKSVLAALACGRGAPASLGSLVTHLEAAMGAPASPPTPSAEIVAALAVVTSGRMTYWQAEGRFCRLARLGWSETDSLGPTRRRALQPLN